MSRQTVTNGDKGEGGSKIGIFTVTYFLNGPLAKEDLQTNKKQKEKKKTLKSWLKKGRAHCKLVVRAVKRWKNYINS